MCVPGVRPAGQIYHRELLEHPLVAKSTTTGLLNAIADVLSQRVFGGASHSRRAARWLDWEKTLRFALCGAFLNAPVYHFWFLLLAGWFPDEGGIWSVASKLLLDQLFMQPIFTTLFLCVSPILGTAGTSSIT
jgi:hypothetical protein